MPQGGLEPPLPKEPDFESGASTDFTTRAYYFGAVGRIRTLFTLLTREGITGNVSTAYERQREGSNLLTYF